MQTLAGGVATVGIGMHDTCANGGAVGQREVHLTAIEPVAVGPFHIDFVGDAHRHRVALTVELAHRIVKSDRVAKEVQQVVAAAAQRRGRDDIPALFVAHQQFNPLGALYIAVQIQVIGAGHTTPEEFLHALLLGGTGTEQGHAHLVVFPMGLGTGYHTAHAVKLQRAGFGFDRDVTVKDVRTTLLDLNVQVFRGLRVEATFGVVTIHRVELVATDVAEQAVFGVTVRAIAQCQQRITRDHTLKVHFTPQTGGCVFERAETIRVQQLTLRAAQGHGPFDHANHDALVQIGGERDGFFGAAKGTADGDTVCACNLWRDQPKGGLAVVQIDLHAGGAFADVGHVPQGQLGAECHGAGGRYRHATGIQHTHHNRDHIGRRCGRGVGHDHLEFGGLAGGNHGDFLADTFDAETVTADQRQGVLPRVQFHRDKIQCLRVVLLEACTLAYAVAAQLAAVHQQAQRQIALALDAHALGAAIQCLTVGQVHETGCIVQRFDQHLERLALCLARRFFRDGVRRAVFIQTLHQTRGQLRGGRHTGFAAHGTYRRTLAFNRQVGSGQRVGLRLLGKVLLTLVNLGHRFGGAVQHGEVLGAQFPFAQRDQARPTAQQIVGAGYGHFGTNGQGFVLHKERMGHGAQTEKGVFTIHIGHNRQALLGHDTDAGDTWFSVVATDTVFVTVHKDRPDDSGFAGEDATAVVQFDHRAGSLGLHHGTGARLTTRQNRGVLVAAFAGGCGELHDIGQLVARQGGQHAQVIGHVTRRIDGRVFHCLAVEGHRPCNQLAAIGGAIHDLGTDQRLVHVVGEVQGVDHELARADHILVGLLVQRQRHTIVWIRRNVRDVEHPTGVAEACHITGPRNTTVKAGEVGAHGRNVPCGGVHHGVLVFTGRHVTEAEEAAGIGHTARHFGTAVHIHQRDGHITDRLVGQRIEQEVTGGDQQLVLQRGTGTIGSGDQTVTVGGRDHIVAGYGHIHPRHRNGGGKENTVVRVCFCGRHTLYIAGQEAAQRDDRTICGHRFVARTGGQTQAGIAVWHSMRLICCGFRMFKVQGTGPGSIAAVNRCVRVYINCAIFHFHEAARGVRDLNVAQVHGHGHGERGVTGKTDFIVALVKEGHGVDFASRARRLVIMTRIARRVIQRNHAAWVGDAVETGVQWHLVAQQNTCGGGPVDADLGTVYVTIGQHITVRVVAQAQRVGQLCFVFHLADRLFLLQLKRAAHDGGLASCGTRQDATGREACCACGRYRQHRLHQRGGRGIEGGTEFVDELSTVAHIHEHRRACADRGFAIVDAAIGIRVIDKAGVVHHGGTLLVLHGHGGVQRDVPDVGDLEVVLRHRATGQHQFGVSVDIQRRHCGYFGVYGVRVYSLDDAQRFVKVGGLRDVPDEGACGYLLGSGAVRQEGDHQRDDPETRHHAEGGFVKVAVHLINPCSIFSKRRGSVVPPERGGEGCSGETWGSFTRPPER